MPFRSFGTTCVRRPSFLVFKYYTLVLQYIHIYGIFHCFACKSRNLLMRTIVKVFISRIDMLGTSYRPDAQLAIGRTPFFQQFLVSRSVFLNILHLFLATARQSLPRNTIFQAVYFQFIRNNPGIVLTVHYHIPTSEEWVYVLYVGAFPLLS